MSEKRFSETERNCYYTSLVFDNQTQEELGTSKVVDLLNEQQDTLNELQSIINHCERKTGSGKKMNEEKPEESVYYNLNGLSPNQVFDNEKRRNPMENFKFIDLFAGIGGFHQAMVQLGGECVLASEIDKYAIETYEENYHINSQIDIRNLKEEDVPKHDVLCAGFPCQAFSKAGKQEGFDDEMPCDGDDWEIRK